MKRVVKKYLITPHTIRLLFLGFLTVFSSVGVFISVVLLEYSDKLSLSQAVQEQLLPLSNLAILLIALIIVTTLTLGILFLLMSALVHKEAFIKGHEHALMCRLVEAEK
jgi:ABC-type spermidine/putrescine transport system permease subunit I